MKRRAVTSNINQSAIISPTFPPILKLIFKDNIPLNFKKISEWLNNRKSKTEVVVGCCKISKLKQTHRLLSYSVVPAQM